MTISQITDLHEPVSGERVPLGCLGYFRARNKYRVFSLVMQELDKSGISQAELARRLGKGADQISRYLAGPGNWTLDTLSDFLFAISGAEVEHRIVYPLQKSPRNDTRPAWMIGDPSHSDLLETTQSRPSQQLRDDSPLRGAETVWDTSRQPDRNRAPRTTNPLMERV